MSSPRRRPSSKWLICRARPATIAARDHPCASLAPAPPFLFGGHRQLAPETPRIHGELLKLGIPFAERTVSRLMPKHRLRPSPTWRTFLANHVGDLVSIDFFTLPTARLRVLSFSSSSLTTAGASSTST